MLATSSIPYSIDGESVAMQPAILLGTQTMTLLRDLSPATAPLPNGWSIERRVVQWGDAREAISVPHLATAVAEGDLVAAISAGLQADRIVAETPPSWRIVTRGRGDEAPSTTYGRRMATSQRVRLQNPADARSCWAESTAAGWLFLMPFGESEASLIVAGYDPAATMETSRLIMPRVEITSPGLCAVRIAPRISQRLCEEGLILTGSAAMRFDPLCGEGAGHALREAYLAVAVVRAASRGESVVDLVQHYETRLRHAFLRHLQVCDSFYGSGGDSEFWHEERAALQEGIRELAQQLDNTSPTQFRFSDLDLEPVIAASFQQQT